MTVNWLPFLAIALLNVPFATVVQGYLMDEGLSRLFAYLLAYLPMAFDWMLFGFKLKPVNKTGQNAPR